MKKLLVPLLVLCLALFCLAGCGGEGGVENEETLISLADGASSVQGGGASAKGDSIRITAGGRYRVSGSLSEGSISVNTSDSSAEVVIVLDGAEISNSSAPAIHIEQSAGTRIELGEGSSNVLRSGSEGSSLAEDAQGAVIYSEDDLDIEGSGALKILGYVNNGIGCKDDLDINSGSIEIFALNNGIRASESLDIKDGSLSVEAGNDGIKTSSAKKEDKGYVKISGGTVDILSSGDGISAETELIIEDGTVTVKAQGDPAELSSNALKARTDINISGGTISLEAIDHAAGCDGSFNISGGRLTAVSLQERGVSAEGDVNVSGGSLNIKAENDGIKSLGTVTLSGGRTDIVSASDGIQAGDKTLSGVKKLSVSGGETYISAYKQAVNAGELEISGGVFLALQNEENMRFDYLGTQAAASGLFAASRGNEIKLRADNEYSMTSGNACKAVFFSAPGITAGGSCSISNGINETPLTVK